MRIGHLQLFDAVAREGGISAAARALGVSQPTVSAQLSALEREHGVRLVDRAAGTLTPLGAQLAALTAPMTELARSATQLLEGAHGTGDGVLRVAADAPAHLMPILAALREDRPGIHLEVRAMNSAASLAAVRDGSVDLAVTAQAPGDPSLHRLALQRQDLAAVVRTDHPLAGRKSMPLRRLAPEPLIGREAGSRTRTALEHAAAAQDLALRTAMVADGRETMLAAVIAGFGVGVIAENEMIDDPRIVMIDLREPVISLTEHLVCAAHRREEPLLRAAFAAASR